MAQYTFIKNKNMYEFHDNNTNEIICFDINIGKWISKKGNPISTNRISKTNVSRAIDCPKMLSDNRFTSLSAMNHNTFVLLDKLLSLGYDVKFYEDETDFFLDNFKLVVKYLSTYRSGNNHDVYFLQVNDVRRFSLREKYTKIYEERVNHDYITLENFISKIIYYPACEKYIDLFIHYTNKNYNVISINNIADYFELCEQVEVPPQKGDFLKNYSEVKKYYESKKDEIQNKTVAKVQTMYNVKGYTNPNCSVEVPTTIDELRTLGDEFHNCLGGWELHNRILPQRYGVVVLRGDNWKVAIDYNLKDRRIDQQYYPCNRAIRDNKVLDIIADFQRYLYSLS